MDDKVLTKSTVSYYRTDSVLMSIYDFGLWFSTLPSGSATLMSVKGRFHCFHGHFISTQAYM